MQTTDQIVGNGMPPRIAELRAEIMARKGSFPEHVPAMLLPVALYRALGQGRSRVQARAAFLYEQVALAPIEFAALALRRRASAVGRPWAARAGRLMRSRQLPGAGHARCGGKGLAGGGEGG